MARQSQILTQDTNSLASMKNMPDNDFHLGFWPLGSLDALANPR
jgi:hypothetical protein